MNPKISQAARAEPVPDRRISALVPSAGPSRSVIGLWSAVCECAGSATGCRVLWVTVLWSAGQSAGCA